MFSARHEHCAVSVNVRHKWALTGISLVFASKVRCGEACSQCGCVPIGTVVCQFIRQPV